MDTLDYIIRKFQIEPSDTLPIEIPNVGRNNMATLFNELGFKRGVEIGVETGLYSEVLCKAIPNIELYCVDAWLAYKGYRKYVTQDEMDLIHSKAKERLSPYGAKLIKSLSMDAVKTFEDESLDFVFIDGNHTYTFVWNDVTEWSKKVRKGGIVSGHDYCWKKNQGNKVIPVVKRYTAENKIDPWFVLGRKERRPDEIRDTARSWMYVKE